MNKVLKQPEVFDHIAKARERFPEPADQDRINGWEKRVREAMIALSLKDNEGVLMLVEKLREKIADINRSFLSDEPHSLSDADCVAFARHVSQRHAERDAFAWMLSFFTDAQQALKEVETDIAEGMGELYPQGETPDKG